MLKRLVVLLAVAAMPLLAACEPPPGSPPCMDIVGGQGSYDGTTVLFTLNLAANTCPDVDYRFAVDEGTGGTRLATVNYRGTNNVARVDYAATVTDDDPTVCVHHETLNAEGELMDRAPDTGCAELTVGEPPPGRGYR